MQKKPAERTVLALLDYSKAYDTVWRSRLLKIMLDKGVPLEFVRWTDSFLRNRQARVKWGGTCGSYRKVSQGVPQGSVLSPLLFLFFIDGVAEAAGKEVKVSLYVDDVAVWAQHRSKEEATRKVQAAVERVAEWSKEARLCLSISKCEVGFFSAGSHDAGYRPVVSVNGGDMMFTTTPKFLGVTFDRTLSFQRHVANVCGKVERRCRLLRAVASRDWGCKRSVLRQLFFALVRGVVDYCGPGWQPWLSRSGVDRLERAQNKAIRAVTGQLSTTPVEALRREMDCPSYAQVTEWLASAAWEKARRLPDTHPRRVAACLENPVRQRLKKGSWREVALAVCDRVYGESVRDRGRGSTWQTVRESARECVGEEGMFEVVGTPPWELGRGRSWSVCCSLVDQGTKSLGQTELRAEAERTMAAYAADTIIYTDGSAVAGTELGGSAAVVTERESGETVARRVIRQRGALRTSSFETEVQALALAVEWLEGEGSGRSRVLICSDSQAALKALDRPRGAESRAVSSVRRRLDGLYREVRLQWVPSHCGLTGNEWVDLEANRAAGRGSSSPFEQEAVVRPAVPRQSMSWSAVRGALRAATLSPRVCHERVRRVYGLDEAATTFFSLPPHSISFVFREQSIRPHGTYIFPRVGRVDMESRRETVLLAQLRSGHCRHLAAYSRLVNPLADPICTLCREEPEDLEHWLQRCPARLQKRTAIFGDPSPPLSVLARVPALVGLYARQTLVRR
jgi:ribonuclease HI